MGTPGLLSEHLRTNTERKKNLQYYHTDMVSLPCITFRIIIKKAQVLNLVAC